MDLLDKLLSNKIVNTNGYTRSDTGTKVHSYLRTHPKNQQHVLLLMLKKRNSNYMKIGLVVPLLIWLVLPLNLRFIIEGILSVVKKISLSDYNTILKLSIKYHQ